MKQLTAFSALLLLTATSEAFAVGQRIPPPPPYIGGVMGDGDPWLPDDPIGGGSGGGGGWNWWNDSGFWGWGSGWWRYPNGTPGDGGGGDGGGDGGGNSDWGGCNDTQTTKRAMENCMVQIETGGYVNICMCAIVTSKRTGQPVDCGTCIIVSGGESTDAECKNKKVGEECL